MSLPIELKYQPSVKRSDLYGVMDFRKGTGYRGGLILSKDKLQTKDKTVVIPVALFLMLV